MLRKYIVIKIDKVKSRKKHSDRVVESQINDDYLDGLINAFNRSEEDYVRALEELSMMDLEELEIKLGAYNMHIIDGVESGKYDQCDIEDINELVRLTGIDIESLRYIVTHENVKKRKR